MSPSDDRSFLSGSVWAEMKKSVSYKVDFSVGANQVILEAQCECTVGQGPTANCKHVACMLFALHSFSASGTLNIDRTCTEVCCMVLGV